MDKNNSNPSSSSSSVCKKIREALASNPAVKAVQRITSFNHQEPTSTKPLTKNPNSQPSSITNITIQNKPPPHHHHNKARTEGSGAIPIKIEHSSKGEAERASKKVAINKGERETHHVPMQEGTNNKQMDINEHFKKFINNTKEKMMRSVTNIGHQAQSNNHGAAAPDNDHDGGANNKNESHFSEFIQLARNKLRTTTTVRKSNYSNKKE